MSGFVVVYECSNTPVDPGVFERVMDRLGHRGPDGRDMVNVGQVIMGHWHFWTTPEEVGEKQPLKLDDMPFRIVLDGRLDNRIDLFNELQITPQDGCHLSDAALILQAYARWGEHCLEHFIGEYALVILDERKHELVCARDSLGERALFYSFKKGNRLVIASEPWAVAGADGISPEINEDAMVNYFAARANEDGQTLFKNVFEVLPAHGLLVTTSSLRTWRYWLPNLTKKKCCRFDEEYAEEFLLLLEDSIRCRLRATTPAGVLMSGGLDSGSVACLAARMMAPAHLTTLSYVFDELRDCDERTYIETVKKQWGIRSIQFPGDYAWPLKDWQNWPRNPNQPCGNPFQLLMEMSFNCAQQEGLNVMLTGGGGDQLYTQGVNWFIDLLSEGRLLEAWRELLSHIRLYGSRKTLTAGFLQRLGRRFFDAFPGGKRLHHQRTAPPWLTPFSSKILHKESEKPASGMESYAGLIGMGIASGYSSETFYASNHNIELRHPFRDRRLVEFVLALPAYQLYNHGMNKYILRTAMQGILPEAIRARRQSNSFNSLYLRGMNREKPILQSCFENPSAAWRKYIDSDWLVSHWSKFTDSGIFRREDAAFWDCITYEVWYNSFD